MCYCTLKLFTLKNSNDISKLNSGMDLNQMAIKIFDGGQQ